MVAVDIRIQTRGKVEYLCNKANILPVHEKMLFHLYYRDGYSTIEISQLLMIHPANVGRRLSRILKKLKKNNLKYNKKKK